MRKRTFDLFELILIVLFAVLIVSAWPRSIPPPSRYEDARTQEQASALKEKYGPTRNSQYEEEWIVRDFFRDSHNGVFVDVGANHYQAGSNTYYLEEHLGWSGIAVEPQRQFEADYIRYRPRTRFYPLFVSDVSDEKARLYVLAQNSLVSSSSQSFTKFFGKDAQPIEVQTITLTELLESVKLGSIDFLSIDVELSEPNVLAGFDVERFKPAFVCIEAHPEVRQQILDYFTTHRYVVVGKYLRVDTQNLYFVPLGGTAAPTAGS
ncbi:MAG: FkbM family methyltransferase [Deltaproteobacteria bacterium]|nr:FkbM family methyltransferase [Deltaproteobacteria bacterium]